MDDLGTIGEFAVYASNAEWSGAPLGSAHSLGDEHLPPRVDHTWLDSVEHLWFALDRHRVFALDDDALLYLALVEGAAAASATAAASPPPSPGKAVSWAGRAVFADADGDVDTRALDGGDGIAGLNDVHLRTGFGEVCRCTGH